MKKVYSLLVLFFVTLIANATNYYVDGINGNNSNNGRSMAQAFLTVQTAANLTAPGDTVFIMNGTYTSSSHVLRIATSGTAGMPIVYTAYPGHTPKLKASQTTFAGVFLVPGTSYITINGLELEGYGVNLSLANDTIPAKAQLTCPVVGSPATSQTPLAIYNGHGISSDSRSITGGGSHHLTITNNIVHDFGAGGIVLSQTDYAVIEGNTTYNNSWYTIYGTSGISFNQSYNYDNNTTTYRNIIRNNISYRNRMYVPFYNDCKVTDGNGIILDIPKTDYNGKSLLANNIVFNNGGSGIHSFKMNNVDILNNVAYQNNVSPEIIDGEIYARQSDAINIINNVLVASPGEKINTVLSSTNLVYDYNIYWGGLPPDVVGTHSILQNPAFANASINPATADFHLQAGSVAINRGDNSRTDPLDKDGVSRPVNSAVDIGAYESSLAGSFNSSGTQQNKILGNAAGNGIGEPGAGSFFGPFDTRTATANQKSRRGIIYPQAMLTTIPANSIINSLQFRRAVQSGSTQVVPDNSIVRIYLRNEAADNFGSTAFDWNSILPGAANPAVLVYGGEASPLVGNGSGWKVVQFQVPFTYTGGHLAVFVEYLQKGSITSAPDIFWFYDNGGTQPLYNITTYPNQLYATKSIATTGNISDALTVNNERRPVMAVGYYTVTLLPVSYQYISAAKNGSAVVVNWLMGNETDNKGFEVQRSSDGVNFQRLGFVASKAINGNSSSPLTYSFTDRNPLPGKSFYRLLQLDKDGKERLSSIVSVNDKAGGLQFVMQYPNPVKDKLQVLVQSAGNTTVSLVVTDLNGRPVSKQVQSLVVGYNTIQVNTSAYPAAVYLMQVTLPSGEKVTRKFVKK